MPTRSTPPEYVPAPTAAASAVPPGRSAQRWWWGWRVVSRLWRHVAVEPMRECDAHARAFAHSPAAAQTEFKVPIVLVTVALALTILFYYGPTDSVYFLPDGLRGVGLAEWGDALQSALQAPETGRLIGLGYWAAVCIFTFGLIPAIVIKGILRERLADYGLQIGHAWRDAWIYAAMAGVMAPLVVIASAKPAFLEMYPFFRLPRDVPLWPTFWAWQAMYFAQFVALEFFFRGFMVHGLRHRLGFASVYVMMVPYCMIHFGKPMPETVAAIVAGIVLGTLSLKTRSIWPGAGLHFAVALTMDLMALARTGRWF